MHAQSANIAALLAAANLHGVTHESGVWRIDGTSRDIDALKSKLLHAICEQASPFVHYDEAPTGNSPLGSAQVLRPGAWRVPRGASGTDLLAWLYMGNWQLYVADSPQESIPDLCRAGSGEVRDFMRRGNVSLVIDSFHDDNHWTVGVAQDDA